MMVRSRMSLVKGLALLVGMMTFSACTMIYPVDETYRRGPWLEDSLEKGVTKAEVRYGEFLKDGYRPGEEGSLTYRLPGMTQGSISFDVTGLDRRAATTTLLALYEEAELEYSDPYVIYNPYLVTVSVKNFDQAPRSPFDFEWTLKSFPSGIDPLQRYVPGIPAGSETESYQSVAPSRYLPIYPDKTHRITVEWMNGQAKLIVDGNSLAEHTYRPHLYNPTSLILVLGTMPGTRTFGQSNLIISNVEVSFPGI